MITSWNTSLATKRSKQAKNWTLEANNYVLIEQAESSFICHLCFKNWMVQSKLIPFLSYILDTPVFRNGTQWVPMVGVISPKIHNKRQKFDGIRLGTSKIFIYFSLFSWYFSTLITSFMLSLQVFHFVT